MKSITETTTVTLTHRELALVAGVMFHVVAAEEHGQLPAFLRQFFTDELKGWTKRASKNLWAAAEALPEV